LRTLSSTLITAQQSHSARPALRLLLDDRHCGAPRYHFTKVREDPAIPSHHSAAVLYDSYLGILTYNDVGTPIFYRYAAGPNPGSPLVRTLTGTVYSGSTVALIYEPSVLWAFVIGGACHLYYATSADNGATWSGWTDFYATPAGTTINHIAVAKGSGSLCSWLLFCDSTTSGVTTLWLFYRVGTTTYGPYAWPRTAITTCRGLAAHFVAGSSSLTQAAFFVAGQSENFPFEAIRRYFVQVYPPYPLSWLYTGSCIAGDHPGFRWSAPSVVSNDSVDRTFLLAQETSPASTYPVLISFRPATDFHSTTGTATPATRRPLPPLGSSTLGLSLEPSGFHYGNPSALYHAPTYNSANRLELTASLLSYRFTEGFPPYMPAGQATFILGSHGPHLDHPSTLTPGAQLMLEEGYVTTAGPEYSQLPPLYIHSVSRSPHQTLIRAYDTWTKLTRQLADFSTTFRTAPASLINFICHLIGIPYLDDASATLQAVLTPPTFTITHGQSLASLLTRILDYTGCAIFFDSPSPASYPSVRMRVFTPTTTTTGAYQFGPSAHPILDWTVDDADQLGTWFTAIFQSDYGEAFDYPHLNALGFPSQLSAYDPNWNSSSDIQPPLAATIMRTFSQHMAHQGSITTRPHVGAEPGDVVYVSADPLAGYYRIIAIAHAFDTYSRPAYTHTYQLAALPSSA